MCCTPLRTLISLTFSTALLATSGCYSMNGYVMNASGQGYYEQGNYALAAQEFQTALANNPANPDYMANLAKTKMKMGDAAGAEQLYQQALATTPSHQPSYHGYAEMMMAQGRSNEALRMLNTWAVTQPYIAESHVELAWLQRELGQHDAAARSLQTALQVNPNHATALAHLGQYYHDAGQPDQAMAMYQHSLQANWNQPEVQSRLASAASAVGAGHPMGEIAMARGVHPHSIPRQQPAAGQPGPLMTPAPAMAQNMIQPSPFPTQPRMAYHPPAPGDYPSPTFSQPAAPQIAQGQPLGQAASMALPPTAPVPVTGLAPGFFGGSDVTMVPPSATPAGSAATVSPAPTADGPAPAPVPDPAFSGTASTPLPVTSVSQTTEVESTVPEVEAF